MALKEYQVWGFDGGGRLTHAGVHRLQAVAAAEAKRVEANWRRWRKRYLAEHPGDYPLRHIGRTVVLELHPVGCPGQLVGFKV